MRDYTNISKKFQAFSDENRLKILNCLKTGEKCACELLECLNIGQPTLSHHMKILCDANVVEARKEGKWMYYTINTKGIEVLVELLKEHL